ncbi:MAG TPA: hypothetical protein PKJ19_11555 [Flavobacteriales bacterium]|nr:hypothetical protein [Flavobacteriales bacterium]HNU57991.1 hypothetical protein [Flavobacteriales bacterium]
MTKNGTVRSVVLWVCLLIAGLALLLVSDNWWHEFIRTSFSYNGEDYYKTEGAVLREHFGKGLFLTVAYPFSSWLIVSFTLLMLTPRERVIYKIIGGLALLYLLFILLYAGEKSYQLANGTFDNSYRVVAISGAGVARVLGIVLGGWLAVRLDVYGRLNALLARASYRKEAHQLR